MSWVIACDREIEEELPLQKAGLPVIYAPDLAPYCTRKVRLLNGAHTSFVPAAYLAGFDIVRDAVLDPDFGRFIRKTLEKEILPTIDQPEEELRAFANSVLERFANPYIDHSLLAICLNSVSKWRAHPAHAAGRCEKERRDSAEPRLFAGGAAGTVFRKGAGRRDALPARRAALCAAG